MTQSVIIKGVIVRGNNGAGGVGENELPDALTWMIYDLRLCKKEFSTTGFPSLSSL